MRGQSEVVGTVVLLALLLAAVAVSYTWGMPLINKNSDANRIVYIKQLFSQLSQDLSKVSREGGQTTLNVQIDKGDVKLETDQTGDYVLSFSMLTDMKFFSETEVPLDDTSSPYFTKEAFLNASTDGCSLGAPPCSDAYSDCKSGTFSSSTSLPADLTGEACICSVDGINYDALVTLEGGTCVDTQVEENIGSTGYKLINIAGGPTEYYATISGGFDTATGVLGSDKPGVVMAKSTPFGRTYETSLKLKPRKILDPSSSEIVVVKIKPAQGSSISSRGSFSITVREGSESVSFEGTKKVRTVTAEVSMK